MLVTRPPVTIRTKTVAAATSEKKPVGSNLGAVVDVNRVRPIAAPIAPSRAEPAKRPPIQRTRSRPPPRTMLPMIRRLTAAETSPVQTPAETDPSVRPARRPPATRTSISRAKTISPSTSPGFMKAT